MIYSRSSEYAIRASIYLAKVPPGECAMAKDIARTEEIPAHFLAKILQQLARKGFLKSTKGPTGGFCLQLKAKDMRLIDIVDAVDGLSDYGRCIAAFPVCTDAMPCALHESWMVLHSRIIHYLERNTIASLVKSLAAQQRNGRPVPTSLLAKVCEPKKSLRSSL